MFKIADMKKQAWFQKKMSLPAPVLVMLVGVLVGSLSYSTFLILKPTPLNTEDAPFFRENAPLSSFVESLVTPLRYSGIQAFMRKNVSIKLDFENNRWFIINKWQYDDQGQVLLDDGKYGVCGELVSYTYQKIKDAFEKEGYQIRVAAVSESNYFPSMTRTTHYVLKIFDEHDSDEHFILDPSLKRYGHFLDFEDYIFSEEFSPASFFKAARTDSVFEIGSATPLLIHNEFVVNFAVREQNSRFTPENFSMGIYATKRYHYSGRPLFWIFNNNGKSVVGEYEGFGKALLGNEQYEMLRRRIIELFNATLRQNLDPGALNGHLLNPDAPADIDLAFRKYEKPYA